MLGFNSLTMQQALKQRVVLAARALRWKFRVCYSVRAEKWRWP